MDGFMNNIWFFGASNTTYWNYNLNWVKEYTKWCGYTPKHFTELLSEQLKLKIVNKAIGATDNYTIFETILKNITNIRKGDKIVVDWVSVLRFRAAEGNKFKTITPNTDHSSVLFFNSNTINEILLNRDSILFVNEVINWTKLLKYLFKDDIIFWTDFQEFDNQPFIIPIYKIANNKKIRIIQETDGNIDDYHYGKIGHLELANKLYSAFTIKSII